MQRTNFFISIGLILFSGIMIFWIIPTQTGEAPDFGLPPSALPMACCVLLAILGLALLLKSLPKTWAKQDEKAVLGIESLKSIALNFGLSILGLVVTWALGFIAGGVVLIGASMYLYGSRSPVVIAGYSVLVPVLLFVALRYGMLIKLP